MTIAKKYDELVAKIREIMPLATVEQDNYGQLIVHTGLAKDGHEGDLVEWSASDDSWDSSSYDC